jgi:hypothetical protein
MICSTKYCKLAISKIPMDSTLTFPQLFEQLKDLLVPYEQYLKVTKNSNKNYELIVDKPFTFNRKNHPSLYFSAVVIEKNYVTLHFFPIYTHPHLFNDLPAGLARQLKGKACFNFKKADDELLEQASDMIKRGFELYEKCVIPLG